MISQDTVVYILQFLCPELSSDICKYVSYVSDLSQHNSSVVIKQSSFFNEGIYGTSKSIPSLPLKTINGVPVLFGEPIIEHNKNNVIIHADIVASTFFLISRYEELLYPDIRDAHGRFPGRNSISYRAGFIERPIVDEYGMLLRECLRLAGVDISIRNKSFSHIYLTHDVDVPWTKYTIGSAIRRELGSLKHQSHLVAYPILNLLGNPTKDPKYTFNTLNDIDKSIASARSIYFVKSGGKKIPEDASPYIKDRAFKKLLAFLKSNNAIIGYHVSYEAGENTKKIEGELATLREVTKNNIKLSRNHYLASREPGDFYALIENGITDDYTMGYADIAGFRLGTCRPVRWIDPIKMTLTDLVLHPLTIMDVTLSEPQYMGLSATEAKQYGDELIKQVHKHGGELVLLWHNSERIGDAKYEVWNNYLHFIETIKSLECHFRI